MLESIIKFVLPLLGGVLTTLFSYEYIEVRKKRKIETYWKIETEYKSDTQQEARKLIETIEQVLRTEKERLKVNCNTHDMHTKLVDFYNTEFHNSTDQSKRDDAWTIRTRIRFLHLTGVLLRKNMIDEDLLFSLIGLGFKIDYETLSIIVDAHRKSHNAPYLYNHFEYLWSKYQNWQSNLSAIA